MSADRLAGRVRALMPSARATERKTPDNLAATLSDGSLAFQPQRLAELPLAAVVDRFTTTLTDSAEPD